MVDYFELLTQVLPIPSKVYNVEMKKCGKNLKKIQELFFQKIIRK